MDNKTEIKLVKTEIKLAKKELELLEEVYVQQEKMKKFAANPRLKKSKQFEKIKEKLKNTLEQVKLIRLAPKPPTHEVGC